MIEERILDIATMSSNAFGWKSAIAGYVGTSNSNDKQVHKAQNEDEYVEEILMYVDDFENIPNDYFNDLDKEEKDNIKTFIKQAKGCDRERLEKLARENWREIMDERSE